MFIGQTLTAENFADPVSAIITVNPSTVYTPWFERQGDAATFYFDILAQSFHDPSGGPPRSMPDLTISVETKNSEQADSAAATLGSVVVANNAVGAIPTVAQVAVTRCLELVRCKYDLRENAAVTTPIERVYYSILRALNPSWSTN